MWFCRARLRYVAFKADLKARMQCNRFQKRYYGCKLCCDRCGAVKPTTNAQHEMTYKDFGPNARYADTLETHATYLRSGRPLSSWAAVDGWQLETVAYDWIHTCYLGFGRGLVPSTLKLLQLLGFSYEAGECDADFLKWVSYDMKTACKEHGRLAPYVSRYVSCRVCLSAVPVFERMPLPRRFRLTPANCGSFGREEYAELGTTFKAAQVKIML